MEGLGPREPGETEGLRPGWGMGALGQRIWEAKTLSHHWLSMVLGTFTLVLFAWYLESGPSSEDWGGGKGER
jgi:hypothetical protein